MSYLFYLFVHDYDEGLCYYLWGWVSVVLLVVVLVMIVFILDMDYCL